MPADWTDPPTFTYDQLVDETDLNTYLRDNLLFLKSNPVIASESKTTNTLVYSAAGSNQTNTGTVLTLTSVAIPADVGAVYVECWAWSWGADRTNNPGAWSRYEMGLNDSVVGGIMGAGTNGSIYYDVNTLPATVRFGCYMRSPDFAWGGTTRTISWTLTALHNTVLVSASATQPAVLRLMRAY